MIKQKREKKDAGRLAGRNQSDAGVIVRLGAALRMSWPRSRGKHAWPGVVCDATLLQLAA